MTNIKKQKKTSIREFVSEDAIKFQLYLMKFSNQLKDLEDKTKEEIEKKWRYDIQKKINRMEIDKGKKEFSSKIAREAIEYNQEYLRNLPVPIDEKQIKEAFEDEREHFIESLENRIIKNESATLQLDKDMLEYAKTLELSSSTSKEKFGELLLLMIKNIATMPSFSGYSDNWKTDFYSNAIEKTLLYLNNFDEHLKSKRTGQNSKAFAYITQICFNAFVNVINIRKKEDAMLKDTISLETANLDGMKHYQSNTSDIDEDDENNSEQNKINLNEYSIKLKSSDDIREGVIKGLKVIADSNDIISLNRYYKDEIDYLEKTTSATDKTKDYYNYLKDLKSKIIEEFNSQKYDTLKIIINKDSKNHKLTENILDGINSSGINIIITSSEIKQKIKNKKRIVKDNKTSKQIDYQLSIQEDLEFFEEW